MDARTLPRGQRASLAFPHIDLPDASIMKLADEARAVGIVLASTDPLEPRHGHISTWKQDGRTIVEIILYESDGVSEIGVPIKSHNLTKLNLEALSSIVRNHKIG